MIPSIGLLPDLLSDAFDVLTLAKPLAEKTYDLGGDLLIVRLASRSEPDLADFEKRKDEILAEARGAKGDQLVTAMSARLCRDADKDHEIDVSADLVGYDIEGEGDRYRPCQTLSSE